MIMVNPNIGCKYPATDHGVLVRSMATVIRNAANRAGGRQFQQGRPSKADPNEGYSR